MIEKENQFYVGEVDEFMKHGEGEQMDGLTEEVKTGNWYLNDRAEDIYGDEEEPDP